MKLLRRIPGKKLIAGAATFIFAEALFLLMSVGAPNSVTREFLGINLVLLGIGVFIAVVLGLVALWNWAS